MCGLPSSGKTTRAKQLATHLESHIATHNQLAQQLIENPPPRPANKKPPPPPTIYQPTVIIVNEESLLTVRSQAYEDANEEKKMRGALISGVERHLRRDQVVILDSMNYIKGFRYQLHCISKAARTTHCIYYCMASPETCRNYNSSRASDPTQDSYPTDLLESLLTRLEEPNPSNRWDYPLFTSIPEDPSPPYKLLVPSMIPTLLIPSSTPSTTIPSTNIETADVIFPNRGTKDALTLTPNQSTKTQPVAEAGYLEKLDKAVKAVSDAVMNAVREGRSGECLVVVDLPILLDQVEQVERVKRNVKVFLPDRSVSVAEMGRMRRLFLKTVNRLESGLDRDVVVDGFAEYLTLNLR
ncbi:hypothetical protein HDU97_000426 [Phlyctochytrium planicorne]|nr:hypothetical protein HDU97_000426 [Phlyctochytrium planicorne]